MKKNKTAKFLTFILLVLAMNTIYVLPYLMYTYYTPLQEAMGLVGRDADYGKLLNVYGIANVILYLPGGWIADKFNPKKLLVFSMISTGILGLWEATWPSYSMLMLIHVLWAVTTVLTCSLPRVMVPVLSVKRMLRLPEVSIPTSLRTKT